MLDTGTAHSSMHISRHIINAFAVGEASESAMLPSYCVLLKSKSCIARDSCEMESLVPKSTASTVGEGL